MPLKVSRQEEHAVILFLRTQHKEHTVSDDSSQDTVWHVCTAQWMVIQAGGGVAYGSGNGIGGINKVNLCRARLLLRWVTVLPIYSLGV